MVNLQIVELMKHRIDELTDDEFAIIKVYCDQKVAHRSIVNPIDKSLASTIVRQMFQKLEGNYGPNSPRSN